MIRKLERTDKSTLETWAGRDPEVFYSQDSYVVEEDGEPVIYLMLSKVRRLDVQFQPGASPIKTARGLRSLERLLNAQDCEIVTDSTAPQIIRLLTNRGFKQERDTFTRKRGNHVLGK